MASLNDAFEKLAKGAGISFAGQIVSTGIKYITQVSLAWLLGTYAFGIYTIGLAIYQLGELFSRMGLELGALRYTSIYYGEKDEQRLKGILLQAFILPLLGGSVLGITFFLASDTLAIKVFDSPELGYILRIFGLTLPIGASGTALAFATTGFQTTKYRVIAWDILIPLVNLLGIISLGILKPGLKGASIALFVACLLSLLTSIYFIIRLFPNLLDKHIKPIFNSKQLLKFSLPLSFGTLLWQVLIWTDILMLGYFYSASEVGIYRAASQTAFLMVLFNRSLTTIFAPMIANLHSQGEKQQLKSLFQTATRWNLSLTLPIFIIVVVASRQILQVFGMDFVAGWPMLIILAAGQLTRAGAGGLAIQMLTMTGHQYLKLQGDILLAGANLILNFLLIPKYGSLGAAIATGISIAGVNFLQVAQVSYFLKIQAYNSSYLKPILAGTATVLASWLLQKWLPPMHFLLITLIISGAIIVIYSTLLFAMGLDKTDKTILQKAQSNLKLKSKSS